MIILTFEGYFWIYSRRCKIWKAPSRSGFSSLLGNFSSYVTCNLMVNIVNNTTKNTKLPGTSENMTVSCALQWHLCYVILFPPCDMRRYLLCFTSFQERSVFNISGNTNEEALQNSFVSLSVSPMSPIIPLWLCHDFLMFPMSFPGVSLGFW